MGDRNTHRPFLLHPVLISLVKAYLFCLPLHQHRTLFRPPAIFPIQKHQHPLPPNACPRRDWPDWIRPGAAGQHGPCKRARTKSPSKSPSCLLAHGLEHGLPESVLRAGLTSSTPLLPVDQQQYQQDVFPFLLLFGGAAALESQRGHAETCRFSPSPLACGQPIIQVVG
jgi:hypothetical protein